MLSSALALLLFPFTSGYLRPAVTRQCTKRVTIHVVILYPLCISLSFSLRCIRLSSQGSFVSLQFPPLPRLQW